MPDEHILQVEPRPRPSVEGIWNRRPHLYPGRALSVEALELEQQGRSGHLALSGQRVSPGIVAGLEVRLEDGGERLQLGPGMGLSASGEDVVLTRLHRVSLSKIPVHRPLGPGLLGLDLGALFSLSDAELEAAHRGLSAAVLVLVPVVSRLDTTTDAEPLVELDPEDAAFEDPRRMDGCALVLIAWPSYWTLPSRATDEDEARWRNGLAWEIFEQERLRRPGELAPWEEAGVPLALLGFELPVGGGSPPPLPMPLFADRAAVVRVGGAPRARTPWLDARGSPLLWQARTLQFAEQLATLSPEVLAGPGASAPFESFPPLGTLPKEAMDLFTWSHRFFPSNFILDALPVPLGQLDAVARASASLAPLKSSSPERVRVLVPVPEEHFEPDLLREELLDPAFDQAIDAALQRVGEGLERRADLRAKATLLADALDGEMPEHGYPTTDPEAVPGEWMRTGPLVPPEEAYETQAGHIPALNALFPIRGDVWQPPVLLGLSPKAVSTAMSSGSGARRGLLVVRNEDDSLRSMGFDPSTHSWTSWTPIPVTLSSLDDFKVLWDGTDFVIVMVKYEYVASDNYGQYRVSVGRQTSAGWTWTSSDPYLFSLTNFTAVCWGPGNIDVFVANKSETGSSQILLFTCMSGSSVFTYQVLSEDLSGQASMGSLAALVSMDPPAAGASSGNIRIDLLFLAIDNSSKPPSTSYVLHHLFGVHMLNEAPSSYSNACSVFAVNRYSALSGTYLSACWTLARDPSKAESGRFDVLVMGGNGVLHGWYSDGGWTVASSEVGKTAGQQLLAASEGDGRIHAFWWKEGVGADSDLEHAVIYSRFQDSGWSAPLALGRFPLGASHRIGVCFNASAKIDLFLALGGWSGGVGMQQLRMVAGGKDESLVQLGLRGIVQQRQALLDQVHDFLDGGAWHVQAGTQQMRQLMISGSTEASRLAVSPVLGATLAQSPLSARADIASYVTRFLQKPCPETSTTQPDLLDRETDARETFHQAVATRRDLTERLLSFAGALQLDVSDMVLTGVADSEITFTDKSGLVASRIPRSSYSLQALVTDPTLRANVLARIEGEPAAIDTALSGKTDITWTPADSFSASTHHMENTLVLLQELERRLAAPRLQLTQYQTLLATLEAAQEALRKRLPVVEGELAEARQDVSVDRALLEEELERIQAINQRRQDTYARHVPFLVFQRPREAELTRDTPSRALEPGLGQDPLPEVLASTAAAPPELLAYLQLVRDSPLEGFIVGPQLLRGLDRLELLQRSFEWASTRALQRSPVQLPEVPGRTVSRYTQGLSQVVAAREAIVSTGRIASLQYLQPASLYTRGWLELAQSAQQVLSLGDLIDTARGRPEVSRSAAEELENIARVAMGLYERLGEVLPALRLVWADQLSQYDGPVELRDLARLPRWGEIALTARREMQRLVDWLFQRVVRTQPEAVSLMNDLVRVCLLLASHAPVNELISGHVARPATVKVGGSLELTVNPASVRVGMSVMIHSGDQLVQAVVDDLGATGVRARVLLASAATVRVQVTDTVRFSEPGRGTGTLLPYVGLSR